MAGQVVQGFFVGGRMRPIAASDRRPHVVQQRQTAVRPARPQAPHKGHQSHDDSFAIDPAHLGLLSCGGQQLPEPLLAKMETAFGADFSRVRVHIGPQAARIGAIAFTTGNDLYFAPGHYQPDTIRGQQLIGHELAHVIQQRQGRARAPSSGVLVLQDHALEAEADRLGVRATMHRQPVQAKHGQPAQAKACRAIQRAKDEEDERRIVPVSRGMPRVSFGVFSDSLTNDLATSSSDASGNIARRLLWRDVELGVRYVSNPTRMVFGEAIERGGPAHQLVPALRNPGANIEVMYVITRAGELVFGVRPHDVRRPHPTLVGEDDPEVLGGGTILMRDGRIVRVRADSGHHRPTGLGTEAMLLAFSRLPRSLFHPDFEGFEPHGAPLIVPTFIVPAWRRELRALQAQARAMATTLRQRIAGNARLIANRHYMTPPGKEAAKVQSDFNRAIGGQSRVILDAARLGTEIGRYLSDIYAAIEPARARALLRAANNARENIELHNRNALANVALNWAMLEFNVDVMEEIANLLDQFVAINPPGQV